MEIGALQTGLMNAIKKAGFASNPITKISFKGLEEDTFEFQKLTDTKEIARRVREFNEKISQAQKLTGDRISEYHALKEQREKFLAKQNPNAAFLSDTSKSIAERKKILSRAASSPVRVPSISLAIT